jgi:hypothetical protein
MKYKYKCDVKPKDLWKMAMSRTYRSPIGVVNVIFTLAMILLSLRYYANAGDMIKLLLLTGCALFPVIQPICTYLMCAKQLEELPKGMELSFDDAGMHVACGEKSEDIGWKRIANAIRRKNMIVIMSDDRHGYMLTNRALGAEKEEFYSFLCEKLSS